MLEIDVLYLGEKDETKIIDYTEDSIENCQRFRKELEEVKAKVANWSNKLQSLHDYLSRIGQSSLIDDEARVNYARREIGVLLGIPE